MLKQNLRSLMALLMAIVFTIVAPGMAQAQPNTVKFTEGGPPIQISSGLSFSGGLQYSDGELRFSLSNGTPNDQLSITSAPNPTAKGAISVDNEGSIFLGNGSGTNRIGSIDEGENGTNGKALTIRFFSPLTNAGFETGDDTGWTFFEEKYNSVQNIQEKSIPYDFKNSGGGTGTGSIIFSTPDPKKGPLEYKVEIDSPSGASGKYALRLFSKGWITGPKTGQDRPTGNGSLHGPYVRSDAFQAFKDDSITLDFSAQNGDDAYEVFGFLIGTGSDNRFGTADDTRIKLFAQRGDKIPFHPVSTTIKEDGQYKFEFVCGTYDKTGGLALGASLYVDNVRLVSATSVRDAEIQAIADRVTYSNSSDNPDTSTRHMNVTRKTANNETDSATVDILVAAVNDAPTIATNVGATVNEGGSVTIASANLRATDPDDSSADLTYRVTSGPTHGTIQLSGVNATSFTQADVDAGLVTYLHDGSETTADSFSFELADGGEDGISPVAGTFSLNVIPQNDAPVVVNPIADRTIYSRRPVSFTIPADRFSDADGDALALTVSLANGAPLPGWLSFDPATGTFSGTPSNDDVGTLNLVVTADDSNGGTVSTGFVLTIERGNYPPVVADPLGDRTITAGQNFSETIPEGTFTDADGDSLTLSATLENGDPLPSWLSFDPATGEFTGTPGNGDISSICITVTAADGNGGVVSDTFNAIVQSVLAEKETFIKPNNGHIYYLTQPLTWTEAQAEASSVDGNLVTINSLAENDWLWGTFGRAEPFWIGLNDAEDEGTFEWVSGQDPDIYFDDYWSYTQPDSGYYGGEEEDYVVMNWRDYSDPSGGWGDVENAGPGYGEAVPGIVEVEPETLDYDLSVLKPEPKDCQ